MGNGISLETMTDPGISQQVRDKMIIEMHFKTYKHVLELQEKFDRRPSECVKIFTTRREFKWLAGLVMLIITCMLGKALK